MRVGLSNERAMWAGLAQLLHTLPITVDDSTYLEEEEELTHYLLSDEGMIWRGTKHTPLGRHWLYGQVSFILYAGRVESMHLLLTV